MHLNMKISRKLTIGFAVLVILTATIGILSYTSMGTLKNTSGLVDYADQAQVKALEARREEKNFIMRGDPTYINTTHTAVAEAIGDFEAIKQMNIDSTMLALVNKAEEYTNAYKDAFDSYLDAYNANAATLTQWKATGDGFNGQITQLQESSDAGSTTYVQADKVMMAFLNMRVSALYFIRTPTEELWSPVAAAMNTTRTEANTLVSVTSGSAQLNTIAKEIVSTVDNYIAKGEIYHQAEVTKAQKDNDMVETARYVIGSSDPSNSYYGGAELLRAKAVASQDTQQASTNMIIIGFIGASIGISIPLAYFIIRSFQNPIKALIDDAKVIAQGNLGHTMKARESKDEIGEVASAFKTMVTAIKDVIVNVRQASESISSLSQHVGSTAQEVNAGMEQVTTATQQISQGTERLSKLAEETAKHVNTLSSILQQTGANTEKSVNAGQQSIEIMEKMKDESRKASNSIDTIQKSMENTAQTVSGMHSSLEKIGELANMVTDVASQTEMLALNAAIEAARAGEAGRGFAVVADAVKELSDQSSQAASETLQSVSQVQSQGKDALDVAQKSSDQANQGAQIIKASIEGTQSVAESMQNINQMLAEISEGVKKGVSSVEGVVKAVDEVSSISEESASACEENSAAMEEQSSAMNQLASNAAQLSEIAIQLKKEIDRFKV